MKSVKQIIANGKEMYRSIHNDNCTNIFAFAYGLSKYTKFSPGELLELGLDEMNKIYWRG